MTDIPLPDAAETALSFLLRVQDDPEDSRLKAELQQWRQADPAHERAWQQALRVRLLGQMALQGAAQAQSPSKPTPDNLHRFPVRRWRAGALATAAAAAIVLACAPSLRLWFQADYTTTTGQTRQIALDDGSHLTLGSASAIAVHMQGDTRRVVLLKGEALFQVKHDPRRTFVVEADGVVSRDIGTVFDVRSGAGHVVLGVGEGTVGLRAPQAGIATEQTVHAGEQIDITEKTGAVRRSAISPDSVGSWNTGLFGASAVSVADMLGILRRHYPGYVIVRGTIPASRLVGGVYDLQRPADSLRMLVMSSGGSMREVAGRILVISFPG
ncbi:FecR domain-containing protein [Komagataeibacter oboediens]|uniref:FecR family protein n=1 Tax=Komagataeibacter oboediens TaxID=65958 RepID=UPI001C2C7480|nr:FecR domain-containing protein [Komagataeibacter oboediens]MBV0889552.1 FecR domain-containing protein [Komagataeibacter oboediens]MCK9821663.1 FecR domain-containing protein [Komagataeibacter oboediens]